ncbi:hypothetical protein [Paracoccus aminovorans]|uniref:hypothetical protein n=1 Tax=Paracoccus aminovorans TaxID=34004 RepID=UPI002B25E1EB|nr:hypothetical protein [Paracoccus aminovorans]
MVDGDQGHVRLLAKSETQGKGAMRSQVADERIRQRFTVFLRVLVLGLERGNMVPVSSRLISAASFAVSITQRIGSVFLISLRLTRKSCASLRPSPMLTK